MPQALTGFDHDAEWLRRCHRDARWAVHVQNLDPAFIVESSVQAARQTAVAFHMDASSRDAFVRWCADHSQVWVAVPLPEEG
jgi:hypothetical protein